MKNCPKCGSQLPENANVCANCGEAISSSADNFTFDYNSLYSNNNEPVQEVVSNNNQFSINQETVPEVSLVQENAVEPIQNEGIMGYVEEPVINVIPEAVPSNQELITNPVEMDTTISNSNMNIGSPVEGITNEPIIGSIPSPIVDNNLIAEQPVQGGGISESVNAVEPVVQQSQVIQNVGISTPNEPIIEPMMPNQNTNMNMTSVQPEVSINPIPQQGLSMDITPNMPTLESPKTIPYADPISSENMSQKEIKNNKMVFITVMVVAFIAIIVMAFFIIKMFSKNDNGNNDSQISKATQYNYEGFEFYLTENVMADVANGEFILNATDNSWSAVITLQDGSYNTLVSNKSQLKGYYEELGYVVEEPEEQEISGTGFVTVKVSMGSENVLIAYAKANGTKLFGIVLKNSEEKYDGNSLKDVGKIFSTMNYKGIDNYLPEGFTIEMFKNTFRVAE